MRIIWILILGLLGTVEVTALEVYGADCELFPSIDNSAISIINSNVAFAATLGSVSAHVLPPSQWTAEMSAAYVSEMFKISGHCDMSALLLCTVVLKNGTAASQYSNVLNRPDEPIPPVAKKVCRCNPALADEGGRGKCLGKVGVPCDYKPTGLTIPGGVNQFKMTGSFACTAGAACVAYVNRKNSPAQVSIFNTTGTELSKTRMRQAMVDFIEKFAAKLCVCKDGFRSDGRGGCIDPNAIAASPQLLRNPIWLIMFALFIIFFQILA